MVSLPFASSIALEIRWMGGEHSIREGKERKRKESTSNELETQGSARRRRDIKKE
jgi:hypothetical protein